MNMRNKHTKKILVSTLCALIIGQSCHANLYSLWEQFKQSPKAQLATAAAVATGAFVAWRYLKSNTPDKPIPLSNNQNPMHRPINTDDIPKIITKRVDKPQQGLPVSDSTMREKIFYLHSKQQGIDECTFWSLYNARALHDLMCAGVSLTSEKIQKTAEKWAQQNGVLQIKQDDEFVERVATILPLQKFYCVQHQGEQNIAITNGSQGFNTGQYSFEAIKKEIYASSEHTVQYFFLLAGGHWTLAAVIKNKNEEPFIVYMNSQNSDLTQESNGYKTLSALAQELGIIDITKEYIEHKLLYLAEGTANDAITQSKAALQREYKKRETSQPIPTPAKLPLSVLNTSAAIPASARPEILIKKHQGSIPELYRLLNKQRSHLLHEKKPNTEPLAKITLDEKSPKVIEIEKQIKTLEDTLTNINQNPSEDTLFVLEKSHARILQELLALPTDAITLEEIEKQWKENFKKPECMQLLKDNPNKVYEVLTITFDIENPRSIDHKELIEKIDTKLAALRNLNRDKTVEENMHFWTLRQIRFIIQGSRKDYDAYVDNTRIECIASAYAKAAKTRLQNIQQEIATLQEKITAMNRKAKKRKEKLENALKHSIPVNQPGMLANAGSYITSAASSTLAYTDSVLSAMSNWWHNPPAHTPSNDQKRDAEDSDTDDEQ